MKLKITPDQIMVLEKLMNQLSDYNAEQELQKVAKSILFDISDKIHARYRKIIKTNDLFNSNKKIDLELKYHEAFAVKVFINWMLPTIPTMEKAHNDLLKLSIDLDQKLA